MIEILDTNIIVRYLVGDDEGLYKKAENIFREAEQGKRKLLIKTPVLAEVCYVLQSFYKIDKDEIANKMEVFLSQKWLKVEDRKSLLTMWNWYRQNLHFIDSFLMACSKVDKCKLLTFDNKLISKLR